MSPRRFAPLLFAAALVTGAARPAAADAALCVAAGLEAERAWGLPAGLLVAIGRVESGRPDPVSGTVAAWPWTINANGRGYHFETAEAALQATSLMRTRGVRSIDVGCYQVNLQHHPQAFATLEQGFDPAANANYAARFLADLQQRTGSWEEAVAAYHSASPARGAAYRARVYAAWTGVPQAPAASMRLASAPPAYAGVRVIAGPPPAVAQAAPAPLAPAAPRAPGGAGAMVWSVAHQAQGMKVWTAMPAGREAPARGAAPARRLQVASR